jgi:hypothetical protein
MVSLDNFMALFSAQSIEKFKKKSALTLLYCCDALIRENECKKWVLLILRLFFCGFTKHFLSRVKSFLQRILFSRFHFRFNPHPDWYYLSTLRQIMLFYFKHLKTQFLLNDIYKSSSYLTGNTLRLRYEDHQINAVIVKDIRNTRIGCVGRLQSLSVLKGAVCRVTTGL